MSAVTYGMTHSFTTLTHANVTAGVNSVLALAPNHDRVYALFVNDSDTKQYLQFGAAANAGVGIPIVANGGSYEISPAHANLTGAAVFVQCSINTKTLSVSASNG
jgi:hypothetical protein